MALILTFQNITALAPVSDYKVEVFVNDRRIDGPFLVTGHPRQEGYAALVQRFLDQHPRPQGAA